MVALLAFVVDWWIGEPKWLYRRMSHPIVLMGNAASWAEKTFNPGHVKKGETQSILLGALGWAILVGGALLIGVLLQIFLSAFFLIGDILTALIAASLLAYKSLAQHVQRVAQGLDQGLGAGREAVSHIVGREVHDLDESGVARASLESLAENFSDGVVAPLFWFIVAGLPGLFVHKMINTLDSMWGYRNQRYEYFGKVAARADDLANWVPARISAGLLVLAAWIDPGSDPSAAWRVASQQASKHRSPNAGWPEGAMAGALNVMLSGPRTYNGQQTSDAYMGPRMGSYRLGGDQIRAGLILYRWAGAWIVVVLLALGMLGVIG